MKGSRFSKAQIGGKLREHEAGAKAPYARRLKALEVENRRLKKLLADALLDNAALKDRLGKITSEVCGTANGGESADRQFDCDTGMFRLQKTQVQIMANSSEYVPAKVWTWKKESGGRFANINRPISGPTHEKELPIGRHPLQLYSLGTPNGVKVTVLLEELLALGHSGAEYDAWLIKIGEGEQFGSGFVAANPNSKIPALVDRSGSKPIRVFESGAILLYLAEKFDAFLPKEGSARAECLSWLFWQMGSTPYLGGGFGHFYAYAPEKIEYAIDRYTMEVKRQLDVLDHRLAETEYIAGELYTVADMAIFPWYGWLVKGWLYGGAEFLSAQEYRNVHRWADLLLERPAVQRGRMVNRTYGDPSTQLHERHDASDFETKTQDKLAVKS
jgi:GSH-dependent disulfide-bond oxidoreductase